DVLRADSHDYPARRQFGSRGYHGGSKIGHLSGGGSGEFGNEHRRGRDDRDGAQHATKLTSRRHRSGPALRYVADLDPRAGPSAAVTGSAG
ncbi:MAG: hypothetical protein QOG19_368, partial [Mycobacterium sp.]|nr:hypothetical protein [Mycobacterium sp.]